MNRFQVSTLVIVVFGFLIVACSQAQTELPSTTESISSPTFEPTKTPETIAIASATSEVITTKPQPSKTPALEPTTTLFPSPTLESPDIIQIRDEFFELYTEAESAYQNADYERALILNDQMLEMATTVELEPLIILAHIFRGDTFAKLKNYEMAIVDYEGANDLEEGQPEILNNLCWWYGLLEKTKKALPYCEEVVDLTPSATYRDSRGLVYGLMGDYEAAIADFEAVVSDLENTTDPELSAIAAQRAEWITIMEAGENPFTPEEMAGLRGEDIASELSVNDPSIVDSMVVNALLTPAPTASPIPLSTIAVISIEADGSGDYETLDEAINEIPSGATIVLGSGTFRLDEPLDINKAIHLVGEGMEQTEVVSEVEGYVVSFAGKGPFISEDITYRHEGTNDADVVIVEDGIVTFIRNRFTGAVSGTDFDGAGLLLLNTSGLVRENIVEENTFAGIIVDAEKPNEQIILERNIVNNNSTGVGIIWGNANGVGRQNECSHNELGMFIGGYAQPMLEGNVCQENTGSGVAFLHESGGIARNNDFSYNKYNGIEVYGQAQPLLEENFCRNNEGSGILYLTTSGGTARGNDCSMNKMNGIDLGDEAEPTLEGNILIGNGSDGIGYYAHSGGTAQSNECSGNGKNGISVREYAKPNLVGNICIGNEMAGISYMENTSGSATQNECSENQIGFWVDEESYPTLEENICENNMEAGIYYWLNATGIARMNDLSGNGVCIYVPETADPILEDNQCYDNVEGEIIDERQ